MKEYKKCCKLPIHIIFCDTCGSEISKESYDKGVIREFLEKWEKEVPECECEWHCECADSNSTREYIINKKKELEEGK